MSAPKPKISSPEEVQYFLTQFQERKTASGLVFLERSKNLQALLDLEIGAADREELIDRLTVQDYYKGPRPDSIRVGDVWEFGSKLKGKEIYIKLAIGLFQGPVLCLSFHRAERKIRFPYR